jgi:hypothetical protein
MSKPSRRPTREARKEHKAKKQAAQHELHRRRAEAGLSPPTPASAKVPNRLSEWKTGEEEQAGREEAAGAQLRVWRALVDKLMKDLGRIPDVRHPKKRKHKLTVLLLHGLLGFVFRMASRREVNRTVSRPVFFATLQELFAELESLPHTDTLNRVLAKLDVAQLEVAYVERLRRLIRGKKFRRYLIKSAIPSRLTARRSWCATASGGTSSGWSADMSMPSASRCSSTSTCSRPTWRFTTACRSR